MVFITPRFFDSLQTVMTNRPHPKSELKKIYKENSKRNRIKTPLLSQFGGFNLNLITMC
jgi:hypothetical protein